MEKEVYTNQQVIKYFEDHFISVKIQMDKTNKDNDFVRSWYKDANSIQNEYGIPGYPTFLFFNPDGKLVNRDLGYKTPNELLRVARSTLNASFVSPYTIYRELVHNYLNGDRNYDIIPFLIDTSKQLGQNELSQKLTNDFVGHLSKIGDDQLYTKINITFLSEFIKGSKSRFFHLFYPDNGKIDSVMQQRGYDQQVVERIIQIEDVIPFANLRTGMAFSGTVEVRQEPDWQRLSSNINDKYQGNYADRLVAMARIQWYSDQQDWANCAKWFTFFVKRNNILDNDLQQDAFINSVNWSVILKWSIDKEQIDAGIESMTGVLRRLEEKRLPTAEFIDTYANLLYKADRVNEAIQWEQKACKEAVSDSLPLDTINYYTATIEKMRRGVPTWPHYISKGDW